MRAFMAPAAASVVLSDAVPVSEGITPTPGLLSQASRADHSHRRLTSVTSHVTAVNGEATVLFTRTFAAKPYVDPAPEEDADLGAVTWKVRSYTKDAAGQFNGCVIKFYRLQALPANLTVVTALAGFRVDMGTVGVLPFTCIAVERSG